MGWSYVLRNPRIGKLGLGSFAIYKQTRHKDGTTTNEAVADPILTKLNQDYQSGALRFDQAKQTCKDFIKALYANAGRKVELRARNSQNERDGDLYWNVYYRQKRLMLKAPENVRWDIARVIRLVGPLSLRTASMAELQEAIEGRGLPADTQRRVVSRLRSILKFLGRGDVDLIKRRPEDKQVLFLTETELTNVLRFVGSNPMKLLMQAALYSGCRIGELMALKPTDLNKAGYLTIRHSLDRKGNLGPPKNGKVRRTYLFPKGRALYNAFLKAKEGITPSMRRDAAKYVKRACKKAFPEDESKWVNFHALRHSYAIMCLEGGLTISEVALFLGDQERVVRQYYIGFVASDAVIERAKRVLGG